MAARNVINNGIGPRKEYLTTTELAKFCGVSRFTILSWIDKGKISTIRTVRGKHRIPVSEAISFLETLQNKASPKEKKVTTSGALGHCWEYQPQNCDLEKLGRYVASYEPAFLTVFPCTTERQDKIFKLLNNAQAHTCSEDSYITKVDLAHLEQCVQKLMELTQEICKKKIDSFA